MNHAMRCALAAVGALILASCSEARVGSQALPAGAEEHPLLDKLMADVPRVPRSREIPHGTPAELVAITHRLRSASEVSRFGELDRPQTHVFGDIADLLVVGDTVYMLEPTVGEIRLFTIEGRHLASFGSKGPGPNELMDPAEIEIGQKGNVTVLEKNGIKIFSIKDQQLSLTRTIAAGVLGGSSACIWPDTLFVFRTRGLRLEKQVHAVRAARNPESRDTAVVTRFGEGYPFGDELVRGRISRGPMSCPNPNTIILGYNDLPLIEAYNVDGTLRWKSGVAEFEPFRTIWRISPNNGRPSITNSDKPGRNRTLVLTALPGGFVLLQIARLDRQGRPAADPASGIDSYVFEVDTGAGVYVGENLPPIKYATRTLLAGALAAEDLAPKITIWRY